MVQVCKQNNKPLCLGICMKEHDPASKTGKILKS
jgi:hypothetical protein